MEYFSFKSQDFFNSFENFSFFYASSSKKPFFIAALPFSTENEESCAYLRERISDFVKENEEKILDRDFFQLQKTLKAFAKNLDEELCFISAAQNRKYQASLTMIVFVSGNFFCMQIGNCPCFLYQNGILRKLTYPEDALVLGSGKAQTLIHNYFFTESFQLLLLSENAIKKENREKLLLALSAPKEKIQNMLSDLFKMKAFGLYVFYQEEKND